MKVTNPMLLVSNLVTFYGLVNRKSIVYGDQGNYKWSFGMTDTDWAEKVKGLLKAELKKRGVSYKQLADKLADIGVTDSEANIKNKISRGGFTAVFFMQCLVAIGCHTIRLQDE